MNAMLWRMLVSFPRCVFISVGCYTALVTTDSGHLSFPSCTSPAETFHYVYVPISVDVGEESADGIQSLVNH